MKSKAPEFLHREALDFAEVGLSVSFTPDCCELGPHGVLCRRECSENDVPRTVDMGTLARAVTACACFSRPEDHNLAKGNGPAFPRHGVQRGLNISVINR